MLKNFIIRLIAYPLSVILICVSCIVLFEITEVDEPIFELKAKLIGLIIILVCLVYIVSDIIYLIKVNFFKRED